MPTAGRQLYDRGWRQGARVPPRVRQIAYSGLDPAELSEVDRPNDMDLVLVTQDCDLVKDEVRLPYLEGICCTVNADLARSVRVNDARYFVLEPAAALIADRAYGAQFTRDAIMGLPPPAPPCGGDVARARRFARWLGARYDRVALSDDAVEHIQRPITNAVHNLCRPGRRHEQLNRDLHEVRVVGNLADGPPFTVALVFVVTEDAAVESTEFAIAELIEAAGFAVEGFGDESELATKAVRIRRWIALPPSRLTVAAYHGSTPLSLEYESLRGDETVGADPLNAESA